MRKIDKKHNMSKVNLLAEQRHLESKGLIIESSHIPNELMVVKSQIEDLKPNFGALKHIKARGIIVTAKAKSKKTDFVSRFFGPGSGIDEDPVTGSAHTKLVPYWAKVFNKTELIAEQISSRKGYLKCKLSDNRVLMAGKGKLFLKGKISI